MDIKTFEKQLQEIDQKFEIIQHPNNPELAGVYYDKNDANKTGFVVTVPAEVIYEEYSPSHKDITGHPHNWSTRVIAVCKEHLRRLAEDKEYYKAFYDALPTSDIASK